MKHIVKAIMIIGLLCTTAIGTPIMNTAFTDDILFASKFHVLTSKSL